MTWIPRAYGEHIIVRPIEPVVGTSLLLDAAKSVARDAWYGEVVHPGGPRLSRKRKTQLPPPVEAGATVVYLRNKATGLVRSGDRDVAIDVVPDESVLLIVEDATEDAS